MIDKSSPVPIYYQLELKIRQMIESEQLQPGDALPSERQFTEKYNISRMTVRQAINNLVNDGLLYRQKGKGTFVAKKKFEQDLSGLTSFNEDMRNLGLTPSNKVLSFKLISGDKRVIEQLKVSNNEPIYEIKRIRLANDEPVALETVYTPQKIVGKMTEEDIAESFYEHLENNLHLKIAYGKQTIEAALANEQEIKHLRIETGDPVLLMRRTSYLADEPETPVEFVKSTYRADKYKFHLQMKRD